MATRRRAVRTGRARPGLARPDLALLVVVLALAGATTGCRDEPGPTRHTVQINALAFDPPTLDARVGDTITWINRDLVPHTVTAPASGWESGALSAGASFTLVLKTAAEVAYLCRFHPVMTGVVRGVPG